MILINCGNFSMFVSEAGHYKDGGEGSLHFDVDSSLSLHNSIYTNLHFIMNNEHVQALAVKVCIFCTTKYYRYFILLLLLQL